MVAEGQRELHLNAMMTSEPRPGRSSERILITPKLRAGANQFTALIESRRERVPQRPPLDWRETPLNSTRSSSFETLQPLFVKLSPR